jgi:hypothetical protein
MAQSRLWSPIFFDEIMGQIVRDVEKDLRQRFSENFVSLANVKDDIIIGAEDADICFEPLEGNFTIS